MTSIWVLVRLRALIEIQICGARIAWPLSSATKYFNALKLCSFCMPKSLPTHKQTTLAALLTFKGCASRWHKCVGGFEWLGWSGG